mgnify:FL=1|tara:strand:+ start:1826 stop:2143 length:318 start_codon:yes stop_codon:yes gene_type:complete
MKLTLQLKTTFKYLQFWNSLFNLTSKELDILTVLVNINEKQKDPNLCSNANKKLAAKELKFKDPNTLNNYVKKFKDKGALVLEGDNYILHKLLYNKDEVEVRILR